ncbi:hypothetical protein D1872_291110 [compost metagenome]
MLIFTRLQGSRQFHLYHVGVQLNAVGTIDQGEEILQRCLVGVELEVVSFTRHEIASVESPSHSISPRSLKT